MKKTIEQLERLSRNPFYKMNEEDRRVLEQSQELPILRYSSVTEDSKKKESQSTVGAATVKETGKLNKHPSDPVSE